MSRVYAIVKRGFLYISALVLVAGYPVSVMADAQEPVTDSTLPITTDQTPPSETPIKEVEVTPQSIGEQPPAPIIIEPNSASKPSPSAELENTTTTTVDTSVTVNNGVKSDAVSGDSDVIKNTTAGSATTGNAAAAATVMNVVNSTVSSPSNKKVATFTKDIYGDVKGDIILSPLLLKAMLEAKADDYDSATVNVNTQMNLNNDIDINAQSGDATVSANTKAGDATSGSAQAVANVVNILNSMIAAQDSFVGTINIYGNLEGDILIAPDFIPQMLANNKGTGGANDLLVSQQTTTNIVNNISAVAESGAASVFGNTNAGNATTGDALSNVVIFNISGHEIIAKNSLLVFVNVLGTWVGVIVDAPVDATAAMIGNGVTSNKQYAPDLTVATNTQHGITNNISVTARTGDATVSYNTNAGNATSGDASAMANVANISNSSFGMSDWFGVLFINVFQSWHGSFGINTAYGDSTQNIPGTSTPPATKPTGPIQFVPAEQRSAREVTIVQLFDTPQVIHATQAVAHVAPEQAVLANSTTAAGTDEAPNETSAQGADSEDYRMFIIAGSILIIGASAIGIRRLLRV